MSRRKKRDYEQRRRTDFTAGSNDLQDSRRHVHDVLVVLSFGWGRPEWLPMAGESQSVATSLHNTAVTGPLSVTDMLLSHVITSVMDLVYIFGLSPHLDFRLLSSSLWS